MNGDPSQDVAHASVIFLVDAKLVLLQPSNNEDGALKYDMRIIANDVEYFLLERDQNSSSNPLDDRYIQSSVGGDSIDVVQNENGLKDSLWYFDGQQIKCWIDIQVLLKTTSFGDNKDSVPSVSVPVDFYPTSIALNKGFIIGIEPDLIQRRDAQFALFRFTVRVSLICSVIDALTKLVQRHNCFCRQSSITISPRSIHRPP